MCVDVSWSSGCGRLVSVDAEQSLSDAVTTLRLNAVHRLVVIDSLTGNALYVLTYTRCLTFLHSTHSVIVHLFNYRITSVYRVRQLYKNLSMLFLFPVKDGKLSTGVNATFNASCYG